MVVNNNVENNPFFVAYLKGKGKVNGNTKKSSQSKRKATPYTEYTISQTKRQHGQKRKGNFFVTFCETFNNSHNP